MNTANHFRALNEQRDAAFPTRESTIQITVTDAGIQQSINEVNQDGTGRPTYQRHQGNVELFIEFIEKQHLEGKFEINGGNNISSLIIPLCFDV